MSGRDEKTPPERPDYLKDFPEEFEKHPGAPSRDLARREREKTDRAAAEAAPSSAPDSALGRIEAMQQRLRELAEKSRS